MTDKEDLIKVTEEPHIISVEMTEDEIRYDQEQLLNCLQRIEDIAIEKKAALADYKARQEKLQETYEDLTRRLRSRKAMRSVMCTLTLNYSKLTATIRNKETGEIIQTRPMSQLERNMDPTENLPFDEDADDAQVNGTSPTEEESTSADPVEESTEIEAEFEPVTPPPDVPDEIKQKAETFQAKLDDANAHAEEMFGSDPTAEDADIITPENNAPQEPDDPGADDDLALWMGLEA